MKHLKTTWNVRTYDVWGNAKDGWDVNDIMSQGDVELDIPVIVNNPGTPQEFEWATPTDRQIREALGLKRIQLDTDGDDLTIYVNYAKDGRPLGELHCISHMSLSPIGDAVVQTGDPCIVRDSQGRDWLL